MRSILSTKSQDIGVLILARGGSKGIPLKNLQTVGGISLLCRAIITARRSDLKQVVVSTDHPLIALEAVTCGATPFKRSKVTATDWAPSIWGVQEYLWSNSEINTLVLIQATSPLTKPSQLRLALNKLNIPKPVDCVFSVARSYSLRWRYENGNVFPLNFHVFNRPRRQDWKGELIETGAFYVSRRTILEKGLFQNNNCSVVEMSVVESLEVDSYSDLLIANALI
uniref:N-acylneuraminate cytidylyltransferase n=1 Tax=Bombyx mori TaxID=7091 RepID=A0A8R2M3W9_BOMMO|nr:N-acylneuraminate cytidylyltransferase A isoform X2 [Bombyx mori]